MSQHEKTINQILDEMEEKRIRKRDREDFFKQKEELPDEDKDYLPNV